MTGKATGANVAEFDPEDYYEDEDGFESPSVRRLYWRAIQTLLIALGIQTVAGLSPSMVESYYSQRLYLFIPWLLSMGNQKFETSLAEVFFLIIISIFALWGLWSAIKAYQGRAPLRDSLKFIFLYIIWTASVLFIVFKLLWGLNYQRQPLAEVAGFESRYARTEDLDEIGSYIANGIRVSSGNLLKQGLAGQVKSAVSPDQEADTLVAMAKTLELGFKATDIFSRFEPWTFGSPKLLESSPVISFLGIRSFYLPFTGEISVQKGLTQLDLPFALARAMAYQRGFAREDEVNMVAFLVCINSSDELVRYSGFIHGAKVLKALEKAGIANYIDGLGNDSTELIRQRDAEAAWSFGGVASSFVDGLFNLHLRINRVAQGTKSVDGDVDLIVSYFLADKGRLRKEQVKAPPSGAE